MHSQSCPADRRSWHVARPDCKGAFARTGSREGTTLSVSRPAWHASVWRCPSVVRLVAHPPTGTLGRDAHGWPYGRPDDGAW